MLSQRNSVPDDRTYRYLIYTLFLLSGVSGLIYQIVWTRMLVLVFGNTMLATSTVLSAFMGGLAAGSYVLGRYIDERPRPLIKVYALLEAGIGVFGLLFPFILKAATPLYVALYAGVEGNIVLLNLVRFAVCFAIIVAPTFLMGGTLPVLIKRFSRTGTSIGCQTGFLYGLNTFGAVAGTVACGYFLLRVLGMQMTTWVAVAINLGVALAAGLLMREDLIRTPGSSEKNDTVPEPALAPAFSRATTRMVLVGIGLSGFCALAYEVFWTRMLNLFLHNNIYSFTAILATFLVGIAVGSLVYARFLSSSAHPVGLFIWLQIGIGVISYATPFIFRLLHGSLFDNFSEALTLAKTSVIMIGPTVMMGIAVPLAIQICQRGVSREGTSVGTVYGVNTIGAIFGAFTAGFILLPAVGLHLGVIIVAGLNILAAFLPFASAARPRVRPAWGVAFVVVIAVMTISRPADLFRGLFQEAHPNADILYYKEGKAANIIVYDFKKLGYKDFHLNAVNEASSRLWHVQLFKMLGLLPTLVHEDPSDALMVAFGAGMSAGACARNVESLDCVDLNPDIQGVAAAYTRENLDVINQPNFNQIVNDGRNALLMNPRKYSLIISDATNPKMLDSWTLYSREFYQLVKDRLKPEGVFCQWTLIPLPGDAINVIINTFRSVFPHMSFWVIHGSTQVLMLGTPERLAIDYDDLARRLGPLYEDAGLGEFGIDSVEKFLSFFLIGEDGIAEMLGGFDKISTDDLPHAQFNIGQDSVGIDNCLDLVRHQESIRSYLAESRPPPPGFAATMAAYEDIARRLTVGFLTNDRLKYAEAAVVGADAGLNDANIAHMLNHCPEKKRHFQARLSAHPDDVTAHNWLGNIWLLEGEYERAAAEFNTTIALRPDHAFARMNLAMTQMAAGEFDAAEKGFLAVRELSPTKPVLNSIAHQLDKLRILRKLAYQPDSAALIRELGVAYYNEGDILDAVNAYRRAAEMSDNDQSTLYNLARICERHEFIPEAARIYGELSRLWPMDRTLGEKSKRLAGLNQDPGQLRSWQNERITVPGTNAEGDAESEVHPPTCDQALTIWNDVDPDGAPDPVKLRKAAELYEQSTLAKPDDLHAYVDAATIFEALREFERAADMMKGATQANPNNAILARQARRLSAMARLQTGQLPDSERAALLLEVASLFHEGGELERGLISARESVKLDPGRGSAWSLIAEMAAEAGLYNEALAAAEQAIAVQPGIAIPESFRETLRRLVDRSED